MFEKSPLDFENPYKNMSPEELDAERQRLLKLIAEQEKMLAFRQALDKQIEELKQKIAELDK